MFDYSDELAAECTQKGVSFENKSGTQAAQIYAEVQDEKNNMDVVRLEKVAKIAVYVPPNTLPWDDAVQLALDYTEIPCEKVWDEEVLEGKLKDYDWIHLHHEDFTGQYGKFFAAYGSSPWYLLQKQTNEDMAKKMGFGKVSQLKLAVVKKFQKQYDTAKPVIVADAAMLSQANRNMLEKEGYQYIVGAKRLDLPTASHGSIHRLR